MKIQPQGNPTISQQPFIDELHPFFNSLAEALVKYYNFLEPYLNVFQLHVYGETMDHPSYKNDKTRSMANSHLAYPDLVLDKFSGTDPDQDVESFVKPIEKKISF